MDPITHIVAGGAAGQSVRRHFPGKAVIPYAMFAAWVPDIDNFISSDPEFYLLHHRGLTHSLAGGFVLAVFLALAVWAWKRRQGWKLGPLIVFTYACVLLHIFLDWVNNFGTQVFAPFSDYRAALGSVFIIDPILSGVLLLLFALSLRSGLPRKPLAGRVAIAFVLTYPFITFAIKNAVESRVAAELDRQAIAYRAVTASPDAFTPFRWKLIAETGEHYLVNTYRLFGSPWESGHETHRRADRDELRRLGRQESFFATWEWFAGPVAVEETSGTHSRTATFIDLRFRSLHPWAQRLQPRGRPPPFSLEAELDADGTLLDWHYYGPAIGSRLD